LKDAYKFYKHSTKRKKGLETVTLRKNKLVDEFVTVMLQSVERGEQDLEKRPSLKLLSWNATRWLGRYECLKSLCRGYEYILEHLTEFAASKSETKKDKAVATELYERLTSYDTFLFIHMYRDLAAIVARTTKLLQSRAIQIRDVGRYVLNLCAKLQTCYPVDSVTPTPLIGSDEIVDTILHELFGNGEGLNTFFW
jgi:hypothetical protein